MKKLAIVTSHPIQYNAPLFRRLTERNHLKVRVFYTWGQTKDGLVYDPDFKRTFQWDIPLQDGYEAIFVENVSENPSAGHFKGIKNNDLIKQVEEFAPDALLVFGWSFHSHLQLLRHYKGKRKLIFRGDSTLLDESPGFSIKKMLRRVWLSWVYRHIDLALYTGEANRQYFLKHGVVARQLIHAPHAVDNQRFADSDGTLTVQAAQWRSRLQIPEDAVVFLFAGKLEPKKDPLLLIKTFQALPQNHLRLLIVGNGMLEQEAKQLAKDDSRILFLDFQNQQQMPVLYRLADIFVLPSKGPGETWGLSVNEAMASGRIVLVSDRCGCVNELVKENGFVFAAGNSNALFHAMQALAILSTAERASMAEKSMKLINKFNYDIICDVLEQSV